MIPHRAHSVLQRRQQIRPRRGRDLRTDAQRHPADSDEQAIEIADDSIVGLLRLGVHLRHRSQLRSGNVGRNNLWMDLGIGFGGDKQSEISREGGIQDLLPYLETKTIPLDETPPNYL